MSDAPELPDFACQDCDADVFQFPRGHPAPDPPLCSVCRWLRDHVPNEAERQRARDRLNPR